MSQPCQGHAGSPIGDQKRLSGDEENQEDHRLGCGFGLGIARRRARLLVGRGKCRAAGRRRKAGSPDGADDPPLTGPLAGNPKPISFDAGPLGPVYLTGIVSGLGLWQNNPFPADQRSLVSLSNGQFIFQKTEGFLQYYVQTGAYTLPALGAPYFNTPKATGDFFSPLPLASLKLAPTDAFSIQGGKLPTLIGAEYTFSFQNMNIERGLLWAQEPAISRGAQLNYTAAPLAFAFSWNDGFYSNRFTWLTGSATYTLDSSNTFAVAAGGNYAHTNKVTTTTPLFQNNETILNVIYTYNATPFTITPYFQYTHVPRSSTVGAFQSASTYGGAILANYTFGENTALSGFSLPVRFEYIASTGNVANGAPNLLYGPGSNAWSVTVTPTYQYGIFFRAGRILACRGTQHDTGIGVRPGRHEHDPDPFSV
jgi:hypothetical protein